MHWTHDTGDILTRVGLVLGFLSAPEFIGVERLKSWEQAVGAALGKFRKLSEGTQKGIVVAIFFFLPASILYFVYGFHNVFGSGLHKPIIGFVVSSLASWFITALDRVVGFLADDSKVRQRALFIGALLFTISFALSFVATYAPPG
jgi:hypothetical protein